MKKFWILGLAALAIVTIAGCGDDTTGTVCASDEECSEGYICVNGFCVLGGDTTDIKDDGEVNVFQDRDTRGDGDYVTPIEAGEDVPPIGDEVTQEDVRQTDVRPPPDTTVTEVGDVAPEIAWDVGEEAGDGPAEEVTVTDADFVLGDVPPIITDGQEIMGTDGDTGLTGDLPDGQCTGLSVAITDGPSRVYANMVEQAIPDGDPTGITSTILVDESDTIDDLQVMVRIEHINVNDLVVSLESPSGTTVILHNREANEYGDVLDIYSWYDDEGLRAKPNQLLSGFDGEDIVGVWTLHIVDAVTGSDPCACDVGPGCEPGCNCDSECGYMGRLVQWEVEFGESTPDEVSGQPYDPLFTWEGACGTDRYFYDSDAMPDVAGVAVYVTEAYWEGTQELNVLHTFFVIGGNGTLVTAPASRTFQFTNVW